MRGMCREMASLRILDVWMEEFSPGALLAVFL